VVFHAGTRAGQDGTAGSVVTGGGRVLGVTGLGPSIADARDRAYRGVSRLGWPGMHHRTDIAAPGALEGRTPRSRSTQEVAG
jgi:phosphoribosylamine--glycine ligase